MKKRAVIICAIAAFLISTNGYCKDNKLVAVYRWYNPKTEQFITVADNEFKDNELEVRGWGDKTFLFYANKEKGRKMVAVYRWHNPINDAYVCIAQNEFTDEQMKGNGYSEKQLLYYSAVQGYN